MDGMLLGDFHQQKQATCWEKFALCDAALTAEIYQTGHDRITWRQTHGAVCLAAEKWVEMEAMRQCVCVGVICVEWPYNTA